MRNVVIGLILIFTLCSVTYSDTVSTVAGNGLRGDGGIGGQAVEAELNNPQDVAIDSKGNLYIAGWENNRITKVDTSGVITVVAGTGEQGFGGDGGFAVNAQLDLPKGVAVDDYGNVYIADNGNNRIRKVDTSGIITTVAGNGGNGAGGDGVAIEVAINSGCVDVDSEGNLFICDGSEYGRVVKVDIFGNATTLVSGFIPLGVDTDDFGNVYIADYINGYIHKSDQYGNSEIVAGNGSRGFSGDGGSALDASFYYPTSVSVDANGNLYITDTYNHRIRKVDTSGNVNTIVGNGTKGYNGDGDALAAELNVPLGNFVDADGDVYFADRDNQRIRKYEVVQDENGEDDDYVSICHKPNTNAEKELYIPVEALSWHLRHGDYEGYCGG